MRRAGNGRRTCRCSCGLSVTDWMPGGWDIEEAIKLCRLLKERGDVDLIDC